MPYVPAAPGQPPATATHYSQGYYPETLVQKRKSWGLGDVAIGFAVFFVVSFVLTGIVAVAGFGLQGGATSVSDLLSNDVISILLLVATGVGSAAAFLGVPLYATYRKGQRSLRKDFGLWFSGWDPLLAIGMSLAGLVVSAIITITSAALFGEQPSNTGGLPTSFSGPKIILIFVTFVVVAVVVPVVEEVFFRGLMLRALQKRFSDVVAVLGSSAVFGLVHITGAATLSSLIAIPLVTGFYGVVFALVTVKTGRLGPAILAHMIINGTAVLALFLL
jgi:uncharacterized protein